MNKNIRGFSAPVLIVSFLVIASVGTAQAEFNVNINVGPPPIVMAAPPEVVLMPQIGVYFVPGISFDVFFYNGYWWSPRGDRWYRAREYNGSWGVVERRYVPEYVLKVPKNYRDVYRKERHINYGHWKKQGWSNDGHKNESRGHRDK